MLHDSGDGVPGLRLLPIKDLYSDTVRVGLQAVAKLEACAGMSIRMSMSRGVGCRRG